MNVVIPLSLCVSLVLASGAPAQAADPSVSEQLQQLKQQLQSQQATINAQQVELSTLRTDRQETWLNERRAEEVKTLVREVLADADTRASLMESGINAGYKNHFFIASDDGNYNLQIYAKLQSRYIYNHREDDTPVDDENISGFTMRRMQLYFDGHAISPNLTYRVLIGAVRTTGSVDLEEAFVKYAFGEGWHVTVGQMKAPFLREYLISSGNLQTVERSYISAVYSLHRSQGVQLGYNTDNLRLTAMIHDGGDQINRDFNADFTDIAIAARAEWLVAGKWSQMRDFMSWSDEPTGLLLGAAINAQLGESGAAVTAPDILSYTFDANIQHKGFSAYFAAVGRHLSADGPTNIPSLDEYGIVAQAGYFLVPDKLEAFGRYEFIHFDGRHYSYRTNAYTAVIDDTVNIVTAGVNYYFKRHNAKFSTDIVWVLDALPVNDTGAGLLRSSERDQIVLRSQFQLFF